MPHEPGHEEKHEHRAMLPEDAPTWQIDIAEGAEIYTADGDKIGEVKEVRGGYFKVNAHFQVDYWLQRQFVTSNDDGKVTMSFKKDDLGDYKVAEPPDEMVAQGQDVNADLRGEAAGFQERIVGGPVQDNSGESGAEATIRAAESESRGEIQR